MAVATFMKCSGHSFELTLFTPLGESKKLTIVQCSACGTPVGVMDPAMAPQIEALKNQIAAIDERLNRIAKALTE
jgi:transcription initiation factor IIE alpha subunit